MLRERHDEKQVPQARLLSCQTVVSSRRHQQIKINCYRKQWGTLFLTLPSLQGVSQWHLYDLSSLDSRYLWWLPQPRDWFVGCPERIISSMSSSTFLEYSKMFFKTIISEMYISHSFVISPARSYLLQFSIHQILLWQKLSPSVSEWWQWGEISPFQFLLGSLLKTIFAGDGIILIRQTS